MNEKKTVNLDEQNLLLDHATIVSKGHCADLTCTREHNDGITLHNKTQLFFPAIALEEWMHVECYIKRCIECYIKEKMMNERKTLKICFWLFVVHFIIDVFLLLKICNG